jgi:hypothetical protein
MKIYITVHMKSIHLKYWETRVESFHLRSENKNPYRKILVVRVIVSFDLHSENKNLHHKISVVGVIVGF